MGPLVGATLSQQTIGKAQLNICQVKKLHSLVSVHWLIYSQALSAKKKNTYNGLCRALFLAEKVLFQETAIGPASRLHVTPRCCGNSATQIPVTTLRHLVVCRKQEYTRLV
jgi:hypothetical protein